MLIPSKVGFNSVWAWEAAVQTDLAPPAFDLSDYEFQGFKTFWSPIQFAEHAHADTQMFLPLGTPYISHGHAPPFLNASKVWAYDS
jgi:hypothetical protein